MDRVTGVVRVCRMERSGSSPGSSASPNAALTSLIVSGNSNRCRSRCRSRRYDPAGHGDRGRHQFLPVLHAAGLVRSADRPRAPGTDRIGETTELAIVPTATTVGPSAVGSGSWGAMEAWAFPGRCRNDPGPETKRRGMILGDVNKDEQIHLHQLPPAGEVPPPWQRCQDAHCGHADRSDVDDGDALSRVAWRAGERI